MTTEVTKKGEIITFYSFKGGTGRTMALANMAVLTSRISKKTLVIDWDLEAPGLHRFFSKYMQLNSFEFDTIPGIIDFFIEVQKRFIQTDSPITDEVISSIIGDVGLYNYIIDTSISGLFLMKAGLFDKTYTERINDFNWLNFFNISPNFFLVFANVLKETFDYIYIDSRTGFTDSSGICTMLLPDKLGLVFTTNKQSLEGVKELAYKALDYRVNSEDFRALKIYPIPSRIELAEKDLRDLWRKGNGDDDIIGFQPLFERIFNENYKINNCDLTDYFDSIQIHHEPKYSYGEEIAVLNEDFSDRLSLTSVYSSLLQKLLFDKAIYVDKPETKDRNDKIKIFFSFSSEETNAILEIMDDLARLSYVSVLNFDYLRFSYLENIGDTTRSLISEADVFIPVVTTKFIKSNSMKYELEYFMKEFVVNRNKILFPLVGVQSDEVPSALVNVLYLRFKSLYNDKSMIVERLGIEVRKLWQAKFEKNIYAELTIAELEFISLCASEMPYKEIALRMGIGTRDLNNLKDDLFTKLNVSSRVGLVLYGFRNHLIEQ